MTAPAQASRWTGTLPLVVLLTFVWGTNWTLFPVAVREVSVWTFRAVGLFGAALLLFGFARWRGLPLRVPPGAWPTIVAAALVYLAVWNVGSAYAAVLIPSGQAAILGFTMPAWAALIAWAFFGDKPSGRTLLAVALAGLGVVLLAWPARQAYATAPAGFALGLMAGVGWAVGTLILKRARIALSPIVLTAWQLLVAAVPLGVVAIVVGDRQWFVPSATSIVVIAYVGLVTMGIGNVAWFTIAGRLPATVSGLSSIMVPMVAMVTGALTRGEPLGPWQLGAMACSGAAMAMALLPQRAARS